MYKILNHHTLKVTCTSDWEAFKRQVPLLLSGIETVLSHLRDNHAGQSIVLFEKFLKEFFDLPLVSLWYDDKNPVFTYSQAHRQHDFTLTGHAKDDKQTMLETRLLFLDPEQQEPCGMSALGSGRIACLGWKFTAYRATWMSRFRNCCTACCTAPKRLIPY